MVRVWHTPRLVYVRGPGGIMLRLGSFAGCSANHEVEALLGGGKLRNVVLWMGSANVLLHGAISLLL